MKDGHPIAMQLPALLATAWHLQRLYPQTPTPGSSPIIRQQSVVLSIIVFHTAFFLTLMVSVLKLLCYGGSCACQVSVKLAVHHLCPRWHTKQAGVRVHKVHHQARSMLHSASRA